MPLHSSWVDILLKFVLNLSFHSTLNKRGTKTKKEINRNGTCWVLQPLGCGFEFCYLPSKLYLANWPLNPNKWKQLWLPTPSNHNWKVLPTDKDHHTQHIDTRACLMGKWLCLIYLLTYCIIHRPFIKFMSVYSDIYLVLAYCLSKA